MNALQHEFAKLRAQGMRASNALTLMVLWRTETVATLLAPVAGRPPMPLSTITLCAELGGEIERLRMTRRAAGVRP